METNGFGRGSAARQKWVALASIIKLGERFGENATKMEGQISYKNLIATIMISERVE
jgi:hypothetical protein